MASQNRGGVLAGTEIILRAVFTDESACLQDLDSAPVLYIYDQSVDSATIEAEAAAKTYTSALAGPLTATNLSTGYYTYTYTVPAGSTAGSWHDLWVGTINTTDDWELFTFEVSTGFNASNQNLGQNTMVIIELSDQISNVGGTSFLQPTSLYYTTKYSPLYASPDLIRLEVGRWIDYIPDDTLALMAHISSKEAQFIQGWEAKGYGNLPLARTKFVVYDAVWRAINIPGQGREAGYSEGKRKQLGDLSISDGKPVTGVSDEIRDWIFKQRQEWWRVVNGGGNIVPGQGFAPTMAVKGQYDPDRRLTGRLWENPEDWRYPQPSVNRKRRHPGRRRGRFGYHDSRPRAGDDYRYPYRNTSNT